MFTDNGPDIESLLGTQIARVAEEINLDEHTMMRRYSLEMEGIVFPDPEVQQILTLWEAKAAQDRGAVMLNKDGSVIEPGNFEYKDAGNTFKDHREAILNVERLRKLVRLELIAKACGIGAADTARVVEADGQVAKTFARLGPTHKRLSQILLTIDEWARPWHAIVENEFPGEKLIFPLSLDDIMQTRFSLSADPSYRQIRNDFGIDFHTHNLFNRVDSSIALQFGNERAEKERLAGNLGAVVIAGLYYNHSPKASRLFVEKYTRRNPDIDWQAELREAATVVKPHLQ